MEEKEFKFYIQSMVWSYATSMSDTDRSKQKNVDWAETSVSVRRGELGEWGCWFSV